MVMMDQSRRLAEPLRWTRAGKLAVLGAGVCLVLAIAGLGLYAALGPSRGGTREGCVQIIFPSTLGAAYTHACGQQARALCSSPPNDRTAVATLRTQCPSAGYRFGS
jgi:hypothetical protein